VRSHRKVTGVLVVAIIASTTVIGISSALAQEKRPSTFYGCAGADHKIDVISTSANLTCPHETKVSWNSQGLKGRPGSTGHAGATGPEGPVGATGPKGVDGLTGAMGPVGPRGTVGPAGAMGSTGPTGPTGAPGPMGAPGPAGATVNCSATPSVGSDFADCNLGSTLWFDRNFDGSNFSGVNFATGTHIYGPSSSMANADFSGASLSQSYLYDGGTFANANFTGANLTGSYLYTNANFTNANFSGANLSNSYLYNGANFTNANFTGANLTGALLSESTLSAAIWDNTTCPGGTNSSAYSPQTCVGH
jgi:hypothetical protein